MNTLDIRIARNCLELRHVLGYRRTKLTEALGEKYWELHMYSTYEFSADIGDRYG